MEKNATRSRLRTATSPMPSEAMSPRSAGRQAAPGAQHRHAGLQVLARSAHVLSRLLPRGDRDAPGVCPHDLLDHHAVRAARHDRTGHHAHALARADRAGEGLAGERAADLGQRRLGVRFQVRAAQRPAVHRRVVVRGHVDRRHDVLGEHAAERAARGDALHAVDRRQAGADRRARRVDRQRLRVVAVHAAHQRADRSPAWVHLSCVSKRASSSRVLMLLKACG